MKRWRMGVFPAVADNPPLPEFFRECAAYYPPKDAGKALGETILDAFWGQDERERNGASEMAMVRARAFRGMILLQELYRR